jgi:hypothetical protein
VGRLGQLASVGVAVATAILLTTACTSGTLRSDPGARDPIPDAGRPAAITGAVETPRSPVVVAPLPEGWSVHDVRWVDDDDMKLAIDATSLQTLYLPPGSTPESGPAIAVGQLFEGNSSPLCSRAGERRTVSVTGRDGTPRQEEIQRLGDRSQLTSAPVYYDDSFGYVFGRGVTDEQLVRVRDGARLDDDGQLVVDADALPRGFEPVAIAPLPPEGSFAEIVTLVREDGRDSVRINAYDGDEAAEYLGRFWDAAVADQHCLRKSGTRTSRTLGDTRVGVEGPDARTGDAVARRLRTTDRRGFDRFTRRTLEQPAAAVLWACRGFGQSDHPVQVAGTEGDVRYAISFPTRPGPRAFSCAASTINGQSFNIGARGGGPANPAATGLELLGGGQGGGNGRGVVLAGGTAPPGTTRIVVEHGPGNTVDAALLADPNGGDRPYFAASIPPPPPEFVFTPSSITAYDGAGHELAREILR